MAKKKPPWKNKIGEAALNGVFGLGSGALLVGIHMVAKPFGMLGAVAENEITQDIKGFTEDRFRDCYRALKGEDETS